MESCYRPISWPMFRRSDGNISISPENMAGQSLSVGFCPLPQTTPAMQPNPADGEHATLKIYSPLSNLRLILRQPARWFHPADLCTKHVVWSRYLALLTYTLSSAR